MTKRKNFDNCIIYKLVCLDTTYPEVYVGSTTCFKQRKYDHKGKCYNEKHKAYNYKIYQYIREHGGFDNFTMIEIEKYPCENGRQLELREEFWRKELHATLNVRQSFTTYDEKQIQKRVWQKNEGRASHLLSVKKYNDSNKEKLKAYCEANKEKIQQQRKARYEANKEKIQQQRKAYRDANKEKIQQQSREYRQRKKLEKLNKEIPETNIIEN